MKTLKIIKSFLTFVTNNEKAYLQISIQIQKIKCNQCTWSKHSGLRQLARGNNGARGPSRKENKSTFMLTQHKVSNTICGLFIKEI